MFSISQTYQNLRYQWYLTKFHTPLDTCVKEIMERRKDTRLKKDIRNFLQNDVPAHFKNKKPIFYFSRYVATPDFETLRYIKQVSHYNFPIIIGEDHTDIFSSHSSLKRNLAKLPIITGTSRTGDGIVEFKTIVNFATQQGKRLMDVETIAGTRLVDFHKTISQQMFPKYLHMVDESAWVDRHSRGKLISLYESMLALLIRDGIMLEYYEPDEIDFVQAVILPAMKITKARFGHTPLIAPLDPETNKKVIDVNSYPKEVKKFAEDIIIAQKSYTH